MSCSERSGSSSIGSQKIAESVPLLPIVFLFKSAQMLPAQLINRPIIRTAWKADLLSVLALYASTGAANNRVLTFLEAANILERIRHYPDYQLCVAESEGDVVGVFSLAVIDNIAHRGAPSGIIDDIVVARAHQRRGIGDLMLSYAMEYCRQRGCYKLSLCSNILRDVVNVNYGDYGYAQDGYSLITVLRSTEP